MSHLITTNIGQAAALSAYRTYLNTAIAAGQVRVKLFRNNFVPGAATVIGDFTEANFNGYTAGGKTLTNPFGTVTTTGAGYAEIVSPDVLTWICTDGLAPNSVYGYWVVDDIPLLLWTEKFDAPIDMTATGNRLNLTLRYSMKSEY